MGILIKNGMVVSEAGVNPMDVLLEGETITMVKPVIDKKDVPAGSVVVEAGGKFVLPGIIDAHTHYHLESRGTVTADSFFEGSRAAAYGGVTTVVDFSDHLPGCSFQEAAQRRIEAMSGGMVCDFGLHQTVTGMKPDMAGELKELKAAGVSTVKIFTTYKREGYLIDDSGLEELFSLCRDMEIMVTVHAEDDEVIDKAMASMGADPDEEPRPDGKAEDGKEAAFFPPSKHPDMRPSESEYSAVKKIGELAGSQNAPVYIVHLSSSRGLEAVRELREKGVVLLVETTPHYLLLDRSLLERENGQNFIMTPPLRTKEDNRALWDGLFNGEIEIIATDHCAFTPEQKALSKDCRTILPGIPGSEELFPLSYTYGVDRGKMSLPALVDGLAAAPARAFGIYPRKGVIAPGSDADLVIFDPHPKWTIADDNRHTMAGYSPYSGFALTGKVISTIRRGEFTVKEGKFTGTAGSGVFLPAGRSSIYEV